MPEYSGPTFYFKTFGCQMNVYDSERLAELFLEAGWRPCPDPGSADLIFLNTCSVREKAVQRVLGHLNHLKTHKKANPELLIALGGCVAQQEGARLFELAPHLDLVVGPQFLPELPSLAAKAAQDRQPVLKTGFGSGAAWSGPRPLGQASFAAPLSAYLTIMQGCDNFCAYCVVPHVRGREISRPPQEIIREARLLLSRGSREITLLGQNVNSYGRGLAGCSFPRLLEEVAALDNLWRLRFTTSHPKDLSPELIRVFGRLQPLCRQLHLPFQSGSNRILRAMGRGYSREEYLNLVARLRDHCPEIVLMADVIVGFPGETEADFEDTLSLVELVRFDGLFSFNYSDRPQAPAARLPEDLKLPGDVKSRRLSVLQARQKEISAAKNRAYLGRRLEVLVEGPFGREAGQLTGRTEGQKIVNFSGPENLSRQLASPLIVRAGANSLLGEL